MAYKPLWDWMDKVEGKKEGSSFEKLQKERERQGYKKESVAKKKKLAKKMVKVMGHEVREGSKKHARLLADKKHYDDLLKSENK